VPPPPVPQAVKEFADFVEAALPTFERLTGYSRRELTGQALKVVLKGGGLESFLGGLMGKPPAQEVKFVRVVKTLAIWVPVFVFLLGLSGVGVILFAKLALMLWGML
jgi:hypothetical protein